MSNEELMEKLKQDMEMRNFSPYTKDFYTRKTREMIEYFKKPMEEVKMEELENWRRRKFSHFKIQKTINKKQNVNNQKFLIISNNSY